MHQENVQYLALRLSSKARSIYNELRKSHPPILPRGIGGSAGEDDEDGDDDDDTESYSAGAGNRSGRGQERVATSTLSGVADCLSSVKCLVSWLNRWGLVCLDYLIWTKLKASKEEWVNSWNY